MGGYTILFRVNIFHPTLTPLPPMPPMGEEDRGITDISALRETCGGGEGGEGGVKNIHSE